MIELKTICAVLHTPSEIVVLGAYQNKWEGAPKALDCAIDTYIKGQSRTNPMTFIEDWFICPLEDVNYVELYALENKMRKLQ